MKHKITLIILLISVFQSYSQDTVSVKISGKIIDDTLLTPIANVEIESVANGLHFKSKSDSLGNYEFIVREPKERLKLGIEFRAENYYTTDVIIDTIVSTDVLIERNIKMPPLLVCWHNFLPYPISFEKNEVKLDEHEHNYLLELLKNASNSLSDIFESRKIEILAYSSYDEEKEVAKARGEYIYSLFIDNNFKKEDLKLTIKGIDDFFYCQYCDGCHYYFLKGKGINMTRETLEKATNETESVKLKQMRRIVEVKWIEK